MKNTTKKLKRNRLANFLFEAATLKRLQRTGWQILGENEESVAEHSYMVCVVSYLLAKQLNADIGKTLMMSLFHDFTEARVGDIYKLADLYVKADIIKAASDALSNLPDWEEIVKITKEYEEGKTLEAKIVHDADVLALCLELKQLIEKGNRNAEEWLEGNKDRLHLDISRQLAREIQETDSQDWWKKERGKIHKRYKYNKS